MSTKQQQLITDPLIVLPGDDVTTRLQSKQQKIGQVIGPGLRREVRDSVVSVRCGQLVSRGHVFWIDCAQHKRYDVSKGDRVIGVVTHVAASTMCARVDIGTHEWASLSLLSFPNATKRNKPNIEIGDVVYCQVLSHSKHTETELVCMTGNGKKDGLGVLKSQSNTAMVVTVPVNVVRRLLAPDSTLITQLGQKYSFEIAIGMNGQIWLNGRTQDITTQLSQLLFRLQFIPKSQYKSIFQ